MSFVDSGYQGDEAQRAAYEASRITITVVPTQRSKASSSCPKGGSLKEPWAGSTARDACQRISRRQSNPHSHGSNWPSLSSLCEGLRGKTKPFEFRVGLIDRFEFRVLAFERFGGEKHEAVVPADDLLFLVGLLPTVEKQIAEAVGHHD